MEVEVFLLEVLLLLQDNKNVVDSLNLKKMKTME